MRLRDWIAAVHALHLRVERGEALTAEESGQYREAREELARLLLAAQRLSLKPGETAREALRIVRALPLELSLSDGALRATTLDLSVGGFSALLPRAPVPFAEATFTLRLRSGPLQGRARVVGVFEQDGAFRASFSLEGHSPEDAQRLESELFDAALSELQRVATQE